MKKYMYGLFLITPTIMAFGCFGQEAGKVINQQSQAWVSINSVVRLTNKWGFVADVHERRNHFFADPGFDENHIFRCFFYFMPDFRKTSHTNK